MSTKVSYRAREHIASLLEILGADQIPGSASNSGNVNSLYLSSSHSGNFVSVVHGSEMIGDTIPLYVEVREELVEVNPSPNHLLQSSSSEAEQHHFHANGELDDLVAAQELHSLSLLTNNSNNRGGYTRQGLRLSESATNYFYSDDEEGAITSNSNGVYEL
jgi:hypothetical protein